MAPDFARLRRLFLLAMASGSSLSAGVQACGGSTENEHGAGGYGNAYCNGGSTHGDVQGEAGCGGSSGAGGAGGGFTGGFGGTHSVDGRPFLVAGLPRVAEISELSDWALCARTEAHHALSAATREALHAAWLESALAEHASIASFARFTLELLSFAAPPRFVAAAQRAALDEIEHARLCFALASRFSERQCGPGRLVLSGMTLSGSLAECARTTFLEGCIGESTAAILARGQLSGARDASVRGALERIARDEEAHAALAWRFVAWALSTGEEAVRYALGEALAAIAQETPRPRDAKPEADPIALRWFGRLNAEEHAALERAAVREVLVPCAEELSRSLPRRSPARVTRRVTA